ncbi:citrate synthase family protein [Bowmanella dokdonensis]|uniref:Citryl-CoA lyase n=1 Tax=Bowmanella dokdonensis TaxID=751969 RepID=A0A939DL90_9ALTE|nr:citryl-CoA lyase [Bowmanella dokdonensis]MBN7824619.1 citryl-CoA lyase [Bowmanella dokdonensis]
MSGKYCYKTRIWQEQADERDPFVAARQSVYGYDVNTQLLPGAGLTEYLYLLFSGRRPDRNECQLLDKLAVFLAHPGLREPSVLAAMNAGAGGSTQAAALIAAISVGAGQLGGAQEIRWLMDAAARCNKSLQDWLETLKAPNRHRTREDIWPAFDYPPGFDPNRRVASLPLLQALDYLENLSPGGQLSWLKQHRVAMETVLERPVSTAFVAASAYLDLGLAAEQASMLHLYLRLPGAAAQSMEQGHQGWRQFPFYQDAVTLSDDPGDKGFPENGGWRDE